MISSSDKLCENYLCRSVSDNNWEIFSLNFLRTHGWLCDGEQHCQNNMDEQNCADKTVLYVVD